MEKKEVIQKLAEALEKSVQERQNRPFPYVVAYYKTANDELMGYHADSACSLTQERLNGKRYHGDNPYSQLEIIRKNLDYTLKVDPNQEKEGLAGVFLNMAKSVKEKYYKDLNKEDIYIMAEYLEDDLPPQKFTYKIIE